MMFKEQELNIYHSITAPRELYDKIVAAQKPKNQWSRYAAGLVAACLVLVMGVGVFFQGGTPDIMINGQLLESSVIYHDLSTTTELRTSDWLSVPVELELSGRSRIMVTRGLLTDGEVDPTTELTASGTVILQWMIPRDTSMCEMRIDSGLKLTTLTLENENSKIIITKKGE
jgi:hypothetical protein